MEEQQLCDFFNENQSVFSFPVKVTKGCSIHETLNQRFEGFLNALKQMPELSPCVDIAKKQITLIKLAYQNYYSGDIAAALRKMRTIINEIEKLSPYLMCNLEDLYIDSESKDWFRARKADRHPLTKADMRHIPASMRGKASNFRYSINGIPCLYIANSIYACWEELDRPCLEDFWVNRYLPIKSIKILNLSTTPDEIVNAHMSLKKVANKSLPFDEAVKGYMYVFALQCACSIVVEEENRASREEYVIPQLLMMQIAKHGIEGIMYFSTKFSMGSQVGASWISKNIAIPAFDLYDKEYSDKIKGMFAMSEPINVGLFKSQLIPRRYIPSEESPNLARTNAKIFVNNIVSIYRETMFYDCECELWQDYYWTGEDKQYYEAKPLIRRYDY